MRVTVVGAITWLTAPSFPSYLTPLTKLVDRGREGGREGAMAKRRPG